MSGAYRDERELARTRLAKLRHEVASHRARLDEIRQSGNVVTALSSPQHRLPEIIALVFVATCVALVCVRFDAGFAAWTCVLLVFAMLARTIFREDKPGAEDFVDYRSETPEQKENRARAIEASRGTAPLSQEQLRQLEVEEQILVALKEEIDETVRFLGGGDVKGMSK